MESELLDGELCERCFLDPPSQGGIRDDIFEPLSRIGKVVSETALVRNVEWTFREEPVLPETVFAPNGALGLFVRLAEWESETHKWKNFLDFTVVETGDSLCGLSVIRRSDIAEPCFFGLQAAVMDVLYRILMKGPVTKVKLEDLVVMSEEESTPLFRFSWP